MTITCSRCNEATTNIVAHWQQAHGGLPRPVCYEPEDGWTWRKADLERERRMEAAS